MKELLKKAYNSFIDFLANKFTTNVFVVGIRDWLKSVINSFKLPPLLSFFITKDGTKNPTLEESMKDAASQNENWDRLGMDQKAIGQLPRWALFIGLCFIVILHSWSDIAKNMITTFSNFMLSTMTFPSGAALPFKYAMDGLVYMIDFFAKFGALLPLAVIFYFLIKSWGSKSE